MNTITTFPLTNKQYNDILESEDHTSFIVEISLYDLIDLDICGLNEYCDEYILTGHYGLLTDICYSVDRKIIDKNTVAILVTASIDE